MSENVDQKRVLKFNSLLEFNAVANTLEYPGLFMIADKNNNNTDGTSINKTAKHAAFDTISKANYGDILLENKATYKMLVVDPEDYSAENYPSETYDAIGICIYPASQRSDHKCVFRSVKLMDTRNPENGYLHIWGNGDRNPPTVIWGDPSIIFGISRDNHDTKYINDVVKTAVKVDWSGNTISNTVTSGSGNFPAFECCWRYHTLCTSPGDWLLPTAYDCEYDNYQ